MKLCHKPLLGLGTPCGRKVVKKFGLGMCMDHSLEELKIIKDEPPVKHVESFEKIAEMRSAVAQGNYGGGPRQNFRQRSKASTKAAVGRWERVRAYRDSLPYACNLRDAESAMKKDAKYAPLKEK